MVRKRDEELKKLSAANEFGKKYHEVYDNGKNVHEKNQRLISHINQVREPGTQSGYSYGHMRRMLEQQQRPEADCVNNLLYCHNHEQFAKDYPSKQS